MDSCPGHDPAGTRSKGRSFCFFNLYFQIMLSNLEEEINGSSIFLPAQLQAAEMRMKGHMTAMEAPLYQSYQVCVLHPLRAKTEVHLGKLLILLLCFVTIIFLSYHMLHKIYSGISGEKVEIDPITQQKVSAKFWVRQRAVSYDTDCIVACDLLETKSNTRTVFR